jgi:hypothetical protein
VAPSTYRLDTLAATLVARLEAVRRAHVDAPASATTAITGVTTEAVSAVSAECRETLGDEAQARLIQREVLETFLPRYLRLALAQNRDEARLGLGGIVGQVAGRVVGVAIGALLAWIFGRILPGRLELIYLLIPPAMLFWPEILLAVWRRRFSAQLQELADDLGRLQEANERISPALDADVTRPPPTRQSE